jgi:Fe-S-cluster containining protein
MEGGLSRSFLMHRRFIKGALFPMRDPELTPIGINDAFDFTCHKKVSCFNHCCRDLNQALTPYDVIRLKNHLKMSSQGFLERYAVLYTGPATGLPVVSLRFTADAEKKCPFVTPQGCAVYEARPSSCRIYPLARALQRSRRDGSLTEHFALLTESHCKGFEQKGRQTVQQWISSQELGIYHKMNDAMMELIAMKNQLRPGKLSAEHEQLTRMAFYDLDTLKEKAMAGQLPNMKSDHLNPLAGKKDDEAWLAWSLTWIAQVLFGKQAPTLL